MSLSYSSFYIQKDNTVKCCGYSSNYVLGIYNATSQNKFVLIPDLENVKQIASTRLNTLFLLNDGTVKGCGYNAYGQLGSNDASNIIIPTLISDLENVKQIACGSNNTMFLMKDGTVKCCGYNNSGQLCLGDTINRNVPTLIQNLENVNQIACGYSHVLFLIENNTIKSCGLNNYRQLGLGDTANRNVPIDIMDIENAKLLPGASIDNNVIKLQELPQTIHNQNINLNGTLSNSENLQIQYKILLNNRQLYPDNDEYTNLQESPINLNYEIENKLFSSENNVITIILQDEQNESIKQQNKIQLINNLPIIKNFKYENGVISCDINDLDNDKIQYNIIFI